MAGIACSKKGLTQVKRDFEFSRLHEEWMAAVYALVVNPERHGGHGQRARAAAAGKTEHGKQCLITDQEVKGDV
jgi:hypothetical protein